jgi:nucleoside-diphosphate-sugar epimerase
MEYLVLGSSGQVGKSLCEYLTDEGHMVHTFDIVDDSLNQDLRKVDAIRDILTNNKIDCVMFLAFDVGGSVYLKKYQDTFDFLHNNMQLLTNTFDTLREFKVPFIFASSQMANMSYSSYGLLKTIGELYTKSLGGLLVKFWNVYGPEEDLEKSHVITDFILKALDDNTIDMLTDGTEVRQFLHATDCSRCLEILSHKYDTIPRDKELHISNFEWHSILDVANIISKQLDNGKRNYVRTKINPADSKDSVQLDKRNEPDEYILTHWKPEITLEDGIKDMIDYYKIRRGE